MLDVRLSITKPSVRAERPPHDRLQEPRTQISLEQPAHHPDRQPELSYKTITIEGRLLNPNYTIHYDSLTTI